MKEIFKCPVCGDVLTKNGNTLKCEKRHSYDISSSGYVNLAMQQSGKTHGDDTFMVMARRDFLSCGYYEPLRTAVCETVSGEVVLDAGCGEGYYTNKIAESENVKRIYGIDTIMSISALLIGVFIITVLGYLLGRITIKGVPSEIRFLEC